MEIASRRSDGKRTTGGQKVIKGFFFYRIHMNGTRIAVNQGVIDPLPVFSNLTVSPSARGHLTLSGAKGALDLILSQRNKIGGGFRPYKSFAQLLGKGLGGKAFVVE